MVKLDLKFFGGAVAKIKKFIADRWRSKASFEVEKWIRSELIPALVHGGMGIQGIEQTNFYKFISSPEGLSQLGIPPSEPPKLLEAYKRTFKVERENSGAIRLLFGDYAKLKMATPHPYSGIGQLRVDSWLDWIVDGDIVADAGFVRRSDLPKRFKKYVRLSAPLGGLMLPKGVSGSTGLWRFPQVLRKFDDEWLSANEAKIRSVISKKVETAIKLELER